MTFESFGSAQSLLLVAGFVLAFIMGAVANKTNFCTMGAVSDWVNMGDLGRFRSWLLAIAVALIGVVLLEVAGLVQADGSFPPYRAGNLVWLENLLGGLLFGIGMTLASGCGNKCLVRIGGGNIKSIFVFLVIAVIAYFMVVPFPGTDATLYSTLFYPWMSPLSISLENGQDLGSMISGAEGALNTRLIIGLVLGVVLIGFAFKSADFRGSSDHIWGGVLIGLCVLGAWYISSNIMVDADGDAVRLADYYGEWDMLAESDEGKPASGAGLNSQSFTFINPMGQAFGYGVSGFNSALLTFGIMAFFGIVAGSLFWSIMTKTFRIEWFANIGDFVTHLVGAVLMGFGGVLAMGCTIGQGITGISTLALGSFITFVAIVLGSAITMKIQLYKMVYEEEASLGKALVAGLADMKLLPNSMRKLDKVD
uniref:PROBABLE TRANSMEMBRANE PROTEIN n=1 Tax=uncultured Thiotrichaceae bacterium TaxID=298394 RepID=A0A6S6TUP5_9GAMM|nr:MAG: PROBABLE TRANSMEMBRANE PROTEIN [uncultured Thiotrichaceae bacterium]